VLTVNTSSGLHEVALGSAAGHAPFYPFGENGESGARMTLRFADLLPADGLLSLWVELDADADGVAAIPIPANDAAFVPSGKAAWMYWMETAEGTASWQPLPLDCDDTYSFHQSGSVRFRLPQPTRRICAVMAEGRYDTVPRVKRIIWNEVSVTQGETHSIVETFDVTADAAGLELSPRHALFADGVIQAQIRLDVGGWEDWQAVDEWPDGSLPVFRVAHAADGVRVLFGDGVRGALPPAGERRVRLIAVSQVLNGKERFGAGSGISGQAVELPLAPILPESLLLQVGLRPEGSGAIVWQDWERKADFDLSAPDSRHYVLDQEQGIVRFSDGLTGAVPLAQSFANIRLLGCRIGGGEVGNVKEEQIRSADLLQRFGPIEVTNIRPAVGGAEPESTGEAFRRAQQSVLEPDCGVTAQDLERLVRQVPGVRIARVKAIPGYRPGLLRYPAERAFGHISVVVVPYSNGEFPLPSPGLLETVRNHLEPYRLLTTRLHVIPPEYVRVTVRAVVVVDPRYDRKANRVREALERLFQPYDGRYSQNGWEFGRTVYKGDVYDAIHRVPGVIYIQDVWLMADGANVYQEEGGDVRIPPNALVLSGIHDIELISS
jgi:hypothetical protein